jgi:hypothetical protein
MADTITVAKSLLNAQAPGQLASLGGGAGSALGGFAGGPGGATRGGRIYRPRMLLTLICAPRDGSGEAIKFPVRVQSARLQVNDHLKADELTVTCDIHDTAVDPRIIGNAVGALFVSNADENGEWTPSDDNLRFLGRVSKAKRHGGEGKPQAVELNLLDYTAFFSLARPFAAKGFPRFEQTIEEAWKTIISGFDNPAFGENPVKALEDALEFRGLSAPGPKLADAAVKRYARLSGQINCDPKADAWAVWQQCCGMVGLISYWDRGALVVTTATDYYTAKRTPKFLWSKNILSFHEERLNDFERKGVGISSYNPLTGKTLEAVWPPVGDKRIHGPQTTPTTPKKTTASSHGHSKPKKAPTEAEIAQREHRDYFQFSGISDPDALLALAKRVFEERSRQEMQGTIVTSEMSVEAADGSEVDLLMLRSGDTIQIQIDDADWAGSAILQSLPDEKARADWFIERGYSEGVARLLARNLQEIVETRREFYVKSVGLNFSTSDDGGEFSLEIGFCNKIEARGDAIVGTSG